MDPLLGGEPKPPRRVSFIGVVLALVALICAAIALGLNQLDSWKETVDGHKYTLYCGWEKSWCKGNGCSDVNEEMEEYGKYNKVYHTCQDVHLINDSHCDKYHDLYVAGKAWLGLGIIGMISLVVGMLAGCVPFVKLAAPLFYFLSMCAFAAAWITWLSVGCSSIDKILGIPQHFDPAASFYLMVAASAFSLLAVLVGCGEALAR